jgi:hypothetical protein
MPSTAITIPRPAVAVPRERVAVAVPWYVWTSVLAVFLGNFGAHWDISWHRSIGRDTFWSPPHLAIYAKGVLAGITFGYLILYTTFVQRRRDDVVTIWGLKGPLGAFIAAWGGIAMITSAPFDDWWHNAYGLDTKIVSPPHIILLVGGYAITAGSLVLVQALRARSDAANRRGLTIAFLILGGFTLVQMMTAVLEWTMLPMQHSAAMYRALAITVPFTLCVTASASNHRWACTAMAALYSALLLAIMWVFPFFPAEPKLGPVYFEVTHMIPNGFPLLLIGPALACDWVLARTRTTSSARRALVVGVTFLAVLLLVQWPFANFLQSPMARNPIFGSHYRSFLTQTTSLTANYRFFTEPNPFEFWRVLTIAFVAAPISAWFGLRVGGWLGRIKR